MQLATDAGLDAVPAATRYTRYRSLTTQLPFLLRESYFYALRLIGGARACTIPEGGAAAIAGWYEPPAGVEAVDAETTQQKLERLVEAPGKDRTPLEWAMSVRAFGQLHGLADRGFDAFVACSRDRRRVWPERTKQVAEPTTLGHVCADLITAHIDALYLKKEGLGIVTSANAEAWWRERKGKSLAELQIETLAAYRSRVAERSRDAAPPGAELDEIDRRLARALDELARGAPLTIDKTPVP
jgi:hypothetical protein